PRTARAASPGTTPKMTRASKGIKQLIRAIPVGLHDSVCYSVRPPPLDDQDLRPAIGRVRGIDSSVDCILDLGQRILGHRNKPLTSPTERPRCAAVRFEVDAGDKRIGAPLY